jgi:hypothetical protein
MVSIPHFCCKHKDYHISLLFLIHILYKILGFYKGYELKTGERYDSPYAYNKSGEWIPYRGGVMLSYILD